MSNTNKSTLLPSWRSVITGSNTLGYGGNGGTSGGTSTTGPVQSNDAESLQRMRDLEKAHRTAEDAVAVLRRELNELKQELNEIRSYLSQLQDTQLPNQKQDYWR